MEKYSELTTRIHNFQQNECDFIIRKGSKNSKRYVEDNEILVNRAKQTRVRTQSKLNVKVQARQKQKNRLNLLMYYSYAPSRRKSKKEQVRDAQKLKKLKAMYNKIRKQKTFYHCNELFTALFKLGSHLFDSENYEESIKYLEQALAVYPYTIKDENMYQNTVNKLIQVFNKTQHFDEFIELLTKVRPYYEQKYGYESVQVMQLWYQLAKSFLYNGCLNEALPLYQALEVLAIKLHGNNNDGVGQFKNKIANIYEIKGDDKMSKKYTLQAIQILKNLNQSPSDILYCQQRLAQIYYREQDYEKALNEMNDCLLAGQFNKQWAIKFKYTKTLACQWVRELSKVSKQKYLSPSVLRKLSKLKRVLQWSEDK